MKQMLTIMVAASVGFAAAALWLSHRQSTPPAATTGTATEVSENTAAPAAGAVEEPRARRVAASPDETATAAPAITVRSPQELLNELATIQVTPGPGQARAQYRILALLDQLAQSGASALPAIREFLAGNRDVAYTSAGRNGSRGGGGPSSTMLPPSLRMGLFDVVRQIGGVDGEQILAETLTATGRSAELAYLSQLLEELSPGKYRDATLTAARNLLTGGKVTDPAERKGLYDVLVQLKDTSFASVAQAGLVQADGKVDRSALRYLQQALGEKSLEVAAQTFYDGRVVDADSKEAIGRLALSFVGANDKALELYHQATLDPQLKPDQRRELVEDLNQDGLSNKRNPTPEDLKLIAGRYALTQSYLQQDYVKNDKTLNAAFLEADKDLRNLLQRAGVLPAGSPAPK
ncbi:MAG: hypothetical protein MUF81_14055 [Verrucomicrobia bacterium]|jgi:hypothetical protein|nr:hypothetical protein [Verrucomicrobiota bacterium]